MVLLPALWYGGRNSVQQSIFLDQRQWGHRADPVLHVVRHRLYCRPLRRGIFRTHRGQKGTEIYHVYFAADDGDLYFCDRSAPACGIGGDHRRIYPAGDAAVPVLRPGRHLGRRNPDGLWKCARIQAEFHFLYSTDRTSHWLRPVIHFDRAAELFSGWEHLLYLGMESSVPGGYRADAHCGPAEGRYDGDCWF